MVNKFLFLAYAFVWILFMLYAWSLSRRQNRLSKEVEALKARTRLSQRNDH
ncbi:MAG TPA: CcmD family protein [Terriglobia bacterium]|nr:CcmD family protein [Terriglobia bacterium]